MTRGIKVLYGIVVVMFLAATVSNLGRILPVSGLFPIFTFGAVGGYLWFKGWKRTETKNESDEFDWEVQKMLDTDRGNR